MPQNYLDLAQEKFKVFSAQTLKAFHKTYKGRLITYRQQKLTRETLKIFALAGGFLVGLFAYLHFISLASTKGYFLKVAQEQLNSVNAKNDIIKLEIMREKKINRDYLSILAQSISKKPLLTIIIPELTS